MRYRVNRLLRRLALAIAVLCAWQLGAIGRANPPETPSECNDAQESAAGGNNDSKRKRAVGGVLAVEDPLGMPVYRPSITMDGPGDSPFRLTQQTNQPFQPYQPFQPFQPSAPTIPGAGTQGGTYLTQEDRRQYLQSASATAEFVPSRAITNTGKADLSEALSQTTLSVQQQRRGQVTSNPLVRGFKFQQIYGQLDGQYFLPIRTDLATVTTLIDPGIVQDVIIIDGPYSVKYGPGFAFLDMVTTPTPRNQPTQYRTSGGYQMNGTGFYGRETVSGGGSNYGYRFSYGHRNGNDYEIGGPGGGHPPLLTNSDHVPSHYNIGDFLADVGYDVAPDSRFEVTYRRVDQNHTAVPGQFFDIASQQTNSVNLRFIDTDPTRRYSQFLAQTWFSQYSMTGNTFNSTKQPTVTAIEQSVTDSTNFLLGSPFVQNSAFTGSTVGTVLSSGGRLATTYGELDDLSLTTGLDARVIQQRIGEFYTVNPLLNGPPAPSSLVSNVPGVNIFETGLPQSLMVNPGAFAEMTLPWTSYFTSRIGARGDYVHTNDLGSTLGSPAAPATNLPPEIPHTSLAKDDGLWAAYMSNTLQIDRNWSGNFSFGQAQRAPSLIDRYADRLFLGIMQSGYSRVIGDPNLSKERNWQIDLALNAKYDLWRGNIRGFQSWVNNYITYSALPVQVGGVFGPGVPPGSTHFPGVVNNADPTSSRLLFAVNTNLATLSGFETYHEFGTVDNWIKPFAAVNYIYGVDQQIHQALPMIPPLQSRLGFNFQGAGGNSPWGCTVYARCVAHQDRAGILRNFVPGAPLVQIEERTPGFTTTHIQGYWNPRGTRFTLFAGIDNVFNRLYIEHLSLRTNPVIVYSPGFSPYMNMEWTY
jgi:hypothetical protein